MTEPQGKSNLEKWQDAQTKFELISQQLRDLKHFDAKGKEYISWQKKAQSKQKQGELVSELYKIKDEKQLSDTAKVHISDVHTSLTTGRETDIENKYIKKGLQVEEDSITLYSRVTKTFYKKNETRLKNLYITGEPDLFTGVSIHEADHIPDIKSSWDAFTFRRTFVKKLNELYKWQLMGYMDLTGAKSASIAYCLVNTPLPIIESEQRKLWYKLGCPDESDSNFLDACKELHVSLTFDDLPIKERLLEYRIERNEEDINSIHLAVIAGRKFMVQLDIDLKNKWL